MSNLQLQQVYQQNYLAEIDNIDREYQGGYISAEDAEEFKAEALLGLQVALESASKGYSSPEQYLFELEEAVNEGYFEGYDDDEVNYNSNDNMANFSAEVEDFSDVLLLGLLNVYGKDNLERGVKDLAKIVGVSEAIVVDWVEGNDVPDLEETDLIAEAFKVDDEEYLALQELTAYERGEDLADYFYDDEYESNDVLENVVDVVETVNDKAEYALAKINQAEFNSAVVSDLNDILDAAAYLRQEGYITPREYDVYFSDLADYSNEDRLAMFSEYCSANSTDEVTALETLRFFLKGKEQCGRVLNYTQYSSDEIGNAEFSSHEPDDSYYRQFARQYVLDELQF